MPSRGRRSQRETIPYICDFSCCRLNVRLPARIQPLLRGHKYRVLSLFGSCALAVGVGAEFYLLQFFSEYCFWLETKFLFNIGEIWGIVRSSMLWKPYNWLKAHNYLQPLLNLYNIKILILLQ